jgi:hypothetical protein
LEITAQRDGDLTLMSRATSAYPEDSIGTIRGKDGIAA